MVNFDLAMSGCAADNLLLLLLASNGLPTV
jgi:hypothetical protein